MQHFLSQETPSKLERQPGFFFKNVAFTHKDREHSEYSREEYDLQDQARSYKIEKITHATIMFLGVFEHLYSPLLPDISYTL